jgi:uncharacterized protein (TIGR02145 family)
MYFFDLLDYYTDKVIGNQYEQIPICDVTWSDMATTSRETSDAYFKALNEWYERATICLEDGECKDAILAKWVQVMDDRTAYINAGTDFWEMMGEECSTDGVFNRTIYDDYISAQNTLLCDIEELMFLVDDGGSGVNPINPCPNCVENNITIGEQVWTKCNLSVSKYRDDTEIPKVTGTTEWVALTTGAWCHYNNDPANDAIYGKLYNWYAVNDTLHGGLAPTGYHIPSEAEWITLRDYLGGEAAAGTKLKEIEHCHWLPAPIAEDATNSSGFTALPGGRRNDTGGFDLLGQRGLFWSTTEYVPLNYGIYYQMGNNYTSLYRGALSKYWGMSIRLIKD